MLSYGVVGGGVDVPLGFFSRGVSVPFKLVSTDPSKWAYSPKLKLPSRSVSYLSKSLANLALLAASCLVIMPSLLRSRLLQPRAATRLSRPASVGAVSAPASPAASTVKHSGMTIFFMITLLVVAFVLWTRNQMHGSCKHHDMRPRAGSV